jgi:intracellular sulfur oxidation DsrE/DsrF family protein
MKKIAQTGKIWFLLGLLCLPALAVLYSLQQENTGKKQHKIVVQFSSRDSLSYDGLINNLTNLEKEWPNATVEVVFHGGGLDMMLSKKTRFAKELESFSENGIQMVVCENTMARKKVTKADLLPFAGTVPMGIGEVVLKQEAGWSYLKLGN